MLSKPHEIHFKTNRYRYMRVALYICIYSGSDLSRENKIFTTSSCTVVYSNIRKLTVGTQIEMPIYCSK